MYIGIVAKQEQLVPLLPFSSYFIYLLKLANPPSLRRVTNISSNRTVADRTGQLISYLVSKQTKPLRTLSLGFLTFDLAAYKGTNSHTVVGTQLMFNIINSCLFNRHVDISSSLFAINSNRQYLFQQHFRISSSSLFRGLVTGSLSQQLSRPLI